MADDWEEDCGISIGTVSILQSCELLYKINSWVLEAYITVCVVSHFIDK